MDFAIVDMQEFKDNYNGFIVKEIVVLTKNIKFYDIIKSPYDIDRLSDKSRKNVDK